MGKCGEKMKSSVTIFAPGALCTTLALLSGCAASGPHRASARPVFYPNATLHRVGGSAGAVSGAFHADQPNSTCRSLVQRCLGAKGFDVIGWN